MRQSQNKAYKITKVPGRVIRRRSGEAGRARAIILMLLLVLLAGGAAGALERQNLIDWWRLQHYTAPKIINDLATQDTMTDYARKVFYVNKPFINDKKSFPKACPDDGGEQTIVLGCYHSDQAGINVLGVTDPRLNGVEQVTAAHEMLHAAYDRLGSSERERVDAMLLDYYNHQLKDERLKSTIDAYKQSEPDDLVNEMHSIFGTEVATLPKDLETYYQRYFTDRSKVAGFAAQYQGEFTSRQQTVAADDAQLAVMKQQISDMETSLHNQDAAIKAKASQLISLRNSNQIAAYNAGVPGYNSLVDAYNAGIDSLQSLIHQYNDLVAARNAVAIEENQLLDDLTAAPQPITDSGL